MTADNHATNQPLLLDPHLAIRPDRRLIRANGRSERFLLVDLVAPTVALDPTRRRPPVNLGFVLDRSGSMGGQNKIGLARQAALEAVHRLEDPDRFSAVVCSAPLLDMVRYEQFGLGETWNDEYGTAGLPEELVWLLSYSPTTM